MKLAFFGTSSFAVPILQALAARPDLTLVTVVTQPDRPSGRGHKLAPTPVRAAAAALGLPVLTPTKLRPFAAELAAFAPDVAVVASYGRIVPQALLDAVPLWLNVHPSLLPRYRGATPMQTALCEGAAETGVTIIAMDAGMDTGEVVAQTPPLPVAPDETYGELHDRLAAVAAGLLLETVAAAAAGTLSRRSQDDARATVTRPWTAADETISLARSGVREVVDRTRALAPRPGLKLDEAPAFPRIVKAHVSAVSPLADGLDVPPGSVVVDRGFPFLRARDGWVVVDAVLPPGKNPMPVRDWANGHRGSTEGLAFRPRAGELAAR